MNENILIVDDNEKLLENISELLLLAGYKVNIAENGIKGLELARKNPPDLILCDIMMPGLDGYGMLRAIQNIPGLYKVPFIFITAKSEKTDFRKGMDLGSDDYLTKPFSREDLLRVISARLKKFQLIKESNSNNNDHEGSRDLKKNNENSKVHDIKSLLAGRIVKNLKKGDTVYMEKDPPFFLYFLLSGRIKIFKTNPYGKEYILQVYQSGDFFGYITLLKDSDFRDSAMAMENSEVALIPRQDFFRLLYSNNEISLKFIRLISNNLTAIEERMIKLAYDSARKRMKDALLFFYRKYNTDKKENFSFPANRENISAIAGITLESVSRNLTDFRDEGLIKIDHKTIRILDLKKLENPGN